MRKSYLKIDPQVFQMASNLFGIGTPKLDDTKATIEPKPELQEKRIFAIYPAIIEEAFSKTMDNYRKYIATYNFQTQAENELVHRHNTAAMAYLKENPLNQEQRVHVTQFRMQNSSLTAREFNALVDGYVYGKVVTKKKIATVKYQTELIFQNLLHLYNSQLMKQNERYMKGGLTTRRPIQEFKVNSYLVTALKRNEVNSIDICTKTVRNHRRRLEEAGVFIEYHFAGRNRAVEVHINPDILTVLDIHSMKLKRTENQSFNSDERNVLPDNNESVTRTIINESEKKENVCNNSLDITSSGEALTPFYLSFTRTHASKQQKITEPAAQKNVKISPISEKLNDLILHPHDLADQLANHEYDNYKPIDIRALHDEASYGTMTKEQFRELCIQDFFKSISKIYKNSTPFLGSWKIAINQYYQSKWIAFTGNSFNKVNIVDDISQLRWRIEWARKWFIKYNFTPLFPSDYFDFTRKTNKEVGFEYTKKKWKDHLSAVNKYDNLRKKQERNAKLRKETINYSKKAEMVVNRFLKNNITYTQLYDYVEKNLPPHFAEKIPAMIEAKTLAMNQKTVVIDGNEFIKYSLYEL